jgi:hypothetical protein
MKNSIQLLCAGLLLAGTFAAPLAAQTPNSETVAEVPNSETGSAETSASRTTNNSDLVQSSQTASPSATSVKQQDSLAGSPQTKPASEVSDRVNPETERLNAIATNPDTQTQAPQQSPQVANSQSQPTTSIARNSDTQTQAPQQSTQVANSQSQPTTSIARNSDTQTQAPQQSTQVANSQSQPTTVIPQAVLFGNPNSTPRQELRLTGTSTINGESVRAADLRQPIAQTPTPETNPPSDTQTPTNSETESSPTTTQTEDNTFSIRGGIRYTTEGAGYERGFSSFEAFFPLFQTPRRNLTFLEGRLLLDNDANLGANVVLGQRFFDASANRVYGGYIAYDNRDTGRNSFNQIGAGFETLGEDWDFRINGYIPIGDTRKQVSETFFNPFFQGNALLLNHARQYEAAVSGVDAEFGGRLARLGNSGTLRGYLGAYYISVKEGDDAVGVRGRLEVRPTDYATLNLSVQHDGIFDTRVVGSVGLTFPGSSARGNGTKPRGLDRMGDTVVRQSAIMVAEQSEIKQVPTINPQTGQPYRFQHVNLGLGASNGSIESPYGNIQDALNATVRDGNDIVYVQSGTNPGIAPFIIPDNVQVLSTGPVQILNTTQVGLLRLPMSGTGVLPVIRAGLLPEPGVTMGNNTVLGGFLIDGSSGPGIFGQNIRNVRIQDNVITNSADQGILLNNVTGRVAIADNTINRTLGQLSSGILINNTSGAVDLRIQGNTIANATNNGIGIVLTETALGEGTISNNTIFNNDGDGIFIGLENSAEGRLDILNNTITGNLVRGIGMSFANTAKGTGNIANNTIARNGTDGIGISLFDTSVGIYGISDNRISDNGDAQVIDPFGSSNGITINLFDTGTGTFDISRNTISGNQGDGISVRVSDVGQGTFNIADNTISNHGNDGIQFVALGNSTSTLTINNNTISNSGRNGIFVNPQEFATSTVTISNNRVFGSGQDGISANTEGNSFLRILIEGNTSSNNGRFGIQLTSLDTSRIFAGVRLNTMTANPGAVDDGFPFGFGAQTLDNSTMCLDLRNNTSSNGFVLRPAGGTFNANTLGNNVPATITDIINPLGACPVP